MDCNSSVHGISQARIQEWITISFYRGSSWPRDRTHVACISCIGRLILYHWTASKALKILVPGAINGIVIALLYENSASQENMLHTCYFIFKLYMFKVQLISLQRLLASLFFLGAIICLCSTSESSLIPPSSLVSTFDLLPGPKDIHHVFQHFFPFFSLSLPLKYTPRISSSSLKNLQWLPIT